MLSEDHIWHDVLSFDDIDDFVLCFTTVLESLLEILWCHYVRSELNRMSTHGLLLVILLLHVAVETGSIVGLSYLVVSQIVNCSVMHVIG